MVMGVEREIPGELPTSFPITSPRYAYPAHELPLNMGFPFESGY